MDDAISESHAWDAVNHSLGPGILWHPPVGHAKRTDEFAFQLPEGPSQATLNSTSPPPIGGAKHIPTTCSFIEIMFGYLQTKPTQRHPNAVYYPDHSLVISLPMRLPAVSCAWLWLWLSPTCTHTLHLDNQSPYSTLFYSYRIGERKSNQN